MSKDNFILHINMKGETKEAMREALTRVLAEFNDAYGKPRQGTISEGLVETYVSTPIWDGKEY